MFVGLRWCECLWAWHLRWCESVHTMSVGCMDRVSSLLHDNSHDGSPYGLSVRYCAQGMSRSVGRNHVALHAAIGTDHLCVFSYVRSRVASVLSRISSVAKAIIKRLHQTICRYVPVVGLESPCMRTCLQLLIRSRVQKYHEQYHVRYMACGLAELSLPPMYLCTVSAAKTHPIMRLRTMATVALPLMCWFSSPFFLYGVVSRVPCH